MPTESQNPERAPVLRDYLETEMRPLLESLGFTGEVRGTPNEDGIGTLASVNDHEQPRYLPGATKG